MHLRYVSSSYVYSFGSYRVDKQTNRQTDKQTRLKASNALCYATTLRNKAFIDIRLRSGIATPPGEDRATATGDLHKIIREDQYSGSRDMLADRQTHRQTDTWIAILRSPTRAE